MLNDEIKKENKSEKRCWSALTFQSRNSDVRSRAAFVKKMWSPIPSKSNVEGWNQVKKINYIQ